MKAFLKANPLAKAIYARIRQRVENLVDERIDQRIGNASGNRIFRLSRTWASGLQPGIASPNALFGSSLCRMEDMQHPIYQKICREALGQEPLLHRKQWEFIYIIHKLSIRNCLQPGSRGLGFGVGTEPLASYFVSKGCEILATDAPEETADEGWKQTAQHAKNVENLLHRNIVNEELFKKNCAFAPLDMNEYAKIPIGYDFHWSSCVIEHLGGIHKATEFVIESSKKLAPGGVAVHTTEFNLSSDLDTVDEPGTCILRGSDILQLIKSLQSLGLEVEPIILDPGQHPYNFHIDAPPYQSTVHLRLELERFSATSIGLVLQKPLNQ